MKKTLITIMCAVQTLTGWSKAGDWKVYPAVDSYWRIEQMGGLYYMLNGSTLVMADTANGEWAQTQNRLNGLSGTSISDIAVNQALQKLAIVYADGNIDILKNMDAATGQGEIHNVPDYANYTITGDRSINSIGMTGDTLVVSTGFGAFLFDMQQEVIRTTLYESDEASQTLLAHCREVTAAHQNSEALARVLEQMPTVNGTQVHQAAQMQFVDGRLYAAQSTFNDYVNYQWGTPVISILDTESDTWTNITANRLNAQLQKLDRYAQLQKVTGLAVDSDIPGHLYVSQLEGGIVELYGDSVIGYRNALLNPDGMTSLLKDNDQQKSIYTRVGAVMRDDDGYVWFTNGDKESATTLRCLTPSGKIVKMSTPGFTGYCSGQYSTIGRLRQSTVDSNHLKWLVRTFHINSAAVCIYYDHGTPETTGDDQCTMFSTLTDQDGNAYTPSYFHDIMEDRNGAMWLLTSIGPFVIDNQYTGYNNPGSVRRIKIPRNDGTNLADYLLAEVSCRCMVVDAANRKWIGTDDAGLYLLSADGLTQLEHFTTDNSPLFSDRIAGLTMDEETGTLYIGTDGGICAYETDVLPDVADNDGVRCYPNPVRADFTGDLTIEGFQMGSTVTVSDVRHHVVFRTHNDGAIIHWNLEGNDGKRIRPGVYYIDAIESDGKKGGSFKFLVL